MSHRDDTADTADTNVSIETHLVPDRAGGPYGITTGPDDALWYTLARGNAIGRLAPSGQPTSHHSTISPSARHDLAPDSQPTIIVTGPDGALWFTEHRSHRIGRITTNGDITGFAPPTPDCGPYGIAPGHDGALWFTEINADRIGRITTSGDITEFPLPLTGAFPSTITAGPDGAMWFTLNQANAIGRITADGAVESHPLPAAHAEPHGITTGPDGALWIALETGALARVTRT